MALFERNYRAAATADLKRAIRSIEERNKAAETKEIFEKELTSLQNCTDFSERVGLISRAQAEEYRRKFVKLTLEFKRQEKRETTDIVDDFENPREKAARYQTMENYNAEIAAQRARNSAAENNNPQPIKSTEKSVTVDDGERTR